MTGIYGTAGPRRENRQRQSSQPGEVLELGRTEHTDAGIRRIPGYAGAEQPRWREAGDGEVDRDGCVGKGGDVGKGAGSRGGDAGKGAGSRGGDDQHRGAGNGAESAPRTRRARARDQQHHYPREWPGSWRPAQEANYAPEDRRTRAGAGGEQRRDLLGSLRAGREPM